MEKFNSYIDLEGNILRFERAALKGHEESIWIVSVAKKVAAKERHAYYFDRDAVKEVFAKTEEPLGWYFAGRLSEVYSREEFDFYKKSAEGGCSWGQVRYAGYFTSDTEFVEKDEKAYLEWVEKAAGQNNPMAMNLLGRWFGEKGNNTMKASAYYRASAQLGWEPSIYSMLSRSRKGIEKDLRQAAIWSTQGENPVAEGIFRGIMGEAQQAYNEGTRNLQCDFDQLCYSLGWGLYWYYGDEDWNGRIDNEKSFESCCLDYYCSCVELRQKSIFTFLLCWNRTVRVKDVGLLIAAMVWEEREDNLAKKFEIIEEQPNKKRITIKL
jgi:hypothetical protein